jgi:hypothetical protein
VYASYPYSQIYTPVEQVGPKDGVFEFTSMVIHATPCDQCAMQLQPSAPRIVASCDLTGEEGDASKPSQRKDKTFAHMHVACAPASLLEGACMHYGAHRLADLPGFSHSPNKPYIAQLLGYFMRRFAKPGEQPEEEGMKKKKKKREQRTKETQPTKPSVAARGQARARRC